MFKKLRTIVLKTILKEFDNVTILRDDDDELHIMMKEPFNNKKGEKKIMIDIYEYVTYQDLYQEGLGDVK